MTKTKPTFVNPLVGRVGPVAKGESGMAEVWSVVSFFSRWAELKLLQTQLFLMLGLGARCPPSHSLILTFSTSQLKAGGLKVFLRQNFELR